MRTKKTLLPLLLASLLMHPGSGAVAAEAAQAPATTAGGMAAEAAEKPISAAEKRIFLDNHLGNLPKSATVEYAFSRTGSLGDNFDDKVLLKVSDSGAGPVASVQFLGGTRGVSLPDIANAEANPVLLNFLERDISQMEKLTTGKKAFFRKRIRLALADSDTVTPITVRFGGQDIKADEVRVQPYLNDPVVKARAEKYEKKTYVFTLSSQVPGGVYQIRTSVAGAGGNPAAPLIDETLTFAKLRK